MATRNLKSLGGKRKAFRSAADFARALANEGDMRLPTFIREMQVGIVTYMYRGIIEKTPVLTGRARENWSLTLTGPSKRLVDGAQKIRTIGHWHAATGAPMTTTELDRLMNVVRAIRAIRAAPLGRKVHFTNNSAYIDMLENGWSGKAPAGMVQVTLASLSIMGMPTIIKNAAAAVPRAMVAT